MNSDRQEGESPRVEYISGRAAFVLVLAVGLITWAMIVLASPNMPKDAQLKPTPDADPTIIRLLENPEVFVIALLVGTLMAAGGAVYRWRWANAE